MKRIELVLLGTWILTAVGTVHAAPTAQQRCDEARIKAWVKYVSCVDQVIAKDIKGVVFDESMAFAKCRHTYFKTWTSFQSSAVLATSTCSLGIGSRYTDNGDQTVTDNLSGLVWEKKDNASGVHDKDNLHSWTALALPYEKENGTTFTGFLSTVNSGAGFGGSNGWRLPTLAELQTIMLDFECRGSFGDPTCSCSMNPCVDPALDPANTQAGAYWSVTSYLADPTRAWTADFSLGISAWGYKTGDTFVRAVRGGL